MYAVIDTGGKQYRVEKGDVIDVEIVPVSGKKARAVEFERVLLVGGEQGVEVGDPVVAGAKVEGVLVDEVRGPKIRVFKMKRRKGYRRTRGHRQNLLRVKIDKIQTGRSATAKIEKRKETQTKD